jgi:putative membrane protein insertion efficiency factor
MTSRLASNLTRLRQSIGTAILTSAHAFYKATLSPLLHTAGIATGSCRFQPTCSEYATLAFAQHNLPRGLWLSVSRLLRCHPFARGGWDPVPPRVHLQPETLSVATIEKPHPTNDPA